MRYIAIILVAFAVAIVGSRAVACIDGNTPEDLVKMQRAAYDQIDARHDGRITFDEWFNSAGGKLDVEVLYNKTHQQLLIPCEMDSRACEEQAKSVFNEMDKNGNGTLTFEEWAIFHPQSQFVTDCM